ncbi:hypothetical protein A0J61_09740, partial [Choanephora cucurbitarum]
MLPQFGFIVAQAGADSHPTTPNNNNNNSSTLGSSSTSHLTKPYPPPTTTTPNDPYYYRHTRSSPPSSLLPPPLPYMYNSSHPPSADYYPPPPPPPRYTPSIYDSPTKQQASAYRPLQPLPPPSSSNNKWHSDTNSYPHWDTLYQAPPPEVLPTKQAPSSVSLDIHSKVLQEDDYSFQRWPEESMTDLNDNKMLRRIREFKDLMTWMDTEFWEQCDDIYREKLQSLQEEIRLIQLGTHSAFKETLMDIELRREKTIEYAEFLKEYELSLSKHQFDQEMSILQEEYQNEKHSLHDLVLQAIDERKRQIREEKEIDADFNVKDLFRDAYARVNTKRNLRKRAGLDRLQNASPSRQ